MTLKNNVMLFAAVDENSIQSVQDILNPYAVKKGKNGLATYVFVFFKGIYIAREKLMNVQNALVY